MGFKSLGTQFQTDIVSDQVAPPWLQNPVGSAYLQAMGQGLDLVRYRSAQASLIHMPGQGSSTADYYIGLDRLLTQGANESSAAFEARLSAAFDTWQHAGNDWAVLQQTLAQLTPYQPKVSIISDTNTWSWYNEAQPSSVPPNTFLSLFANWNWDDEAYDPHPLSLTAWWRFWLILQSGLNIVGGTITHATTGAPVEITTASAHGLSTGGVVYIDQVEGVVGANGGPFVVTVIDTTHFTVPTTGTGSYTSGGYVFSPDAENWAHPFPSLGTPGAPTLGGSASTSLGFGNVPPSFWVTLRSVVQTFKAAHAWLRWIIVSYDSSWFNQDTGLIGTGMPDGTWGPNVVIDYTSHGQGIYVATRYSNARFVPGVI
jgi:hypothetical protein